MSKLQRIKELAIAAIMIAAALVLWLVPEEGYNIVLLILSATLLISGIRSIIYYFTMARHMVGGGIIFIKGVLITDLALITFSLTNIPQRLVMIYLLLYYVFSGVIDILQAFESRQHQAPHWKRKFIIGAVSVIIAVVGVIFSYSVEIVVLVYCIGLFYMAVLRIISAVRRSAIIFIA